LIYFSLLETTECLTVATYTSVVTSCDYCYHMCKLINA